MPTENPSERRAIAVGAIGIACLLIASLGYALYDSGTHYDAEQINQFVLEKQSAMPETAR